MTRRTVFVTVREKLTFFWFLGPLYNLFVDSPWSHLHIPYWICVGEYSFQGGAGHGYISLMAATIFMALLLWGLRLLPLGRYSRRFPALSAFRRCVTRWILSSDWFRNYVHLRFRFPFSSNFYGKWSWPWSLFLTPTTSCLVPITQDVIHSFVSQEDTFQDSQDGDPMSYWWTLELLGQSMIAPVICSIGPYRIPRTAFTWYFVISFGFSATLLDMVIVLFILDFMCSFCVFLPKSLMACLVLWCNFQETICTFG